MDMDDKIRASFTKHGLMRAIGARLTHIAPGHVEIELPYSDAVTQQHGYFHAAASAAIADTGGGYAALTLMNADDEVLAVEFKINLLRPAVGDRLIAVARVLKPGKTLTICQIEVFAERDGARVQVAHVMQTNFRQTAPAAALG